MQHRAHRSHGAKTGRFPKRIFQKVGKFSAAKKCPSSTTIYHAIHHNFTTIYHHQTPQKCKNPLQKRLSTAKTFFPPIHNRKTPPVRLDPCGSFSPFYSSARLPPW